VLDARDREKMRQQSALQRAGRRAEPGTLPIRRSESCAALAPEQALGASLVRCRLRNDSKQAQSVRAGERRSAGERLRRGSLAGAGQGKRGRQRHGLGGLHLLS
jgi:hypothetical protein